ncbi:hypothetical protein SLS59_000677 [Nothophoma quercina]|uniref:Xylanolytic transcriptional activator regulatory domain-containing protein n=1 Tax=Nothophoma quercina TaxID=749835 RepID=A0ABR3S2Y6_9PLEO
MIPYSSTFDVFSAPNISGYQNDFDDLGWMTGSLDPYLWPISFDLGQEFDMLQNAGGSHTTTKQTTAVVAAAATKGLPPTPASDIADLYSRSHSPALDKDAVEVRQYHPTSIEVDAPLHFPDVDPASLADAELEDFAHVHALTSEKMEAITQLAEDIQRGPHHPPFTNLKLPPQPILNAWVQLYFEYFHPVFPILHKPTFSLPEVDPLLVLAVAGIGAQFSSLKNARTFARGIHELVRRRSSSQCEKQNKFGRTVWMTQVIMLNNLAMSHSGDRRELEIAEILQAVPIALARRKGVLEDTLPHDRVAKLQLPLEQTWRLWAVDEERRRTGFGAWLIDFTFRAHFNLTSIMDPCELRNTLPQTEDRWGAISAQSWAGYPPGLARETLESLLSTMDAPQDDASLYDLKASLTHRVMCLAALMICHAPATDLTVAALRQMYRRLDDHELSNIAQKWKESSAQGRMTVYYAARLLETVRNNHATHYAMPVYLLKAVLTLWLYARLFDNSNLTGFTTSINITNPNDADVDQWKLAGPSRIRLPGIADLLSRQGRRKLLSESIIAMHSLGSWGVSKVYLDLLKRLEASEPAT